MPALSRTCIVAALAVVFSWHTAIDALAQSTARQPSSQTGSAAATGFAPDVQGQRLALVIGNAAYREGALANPANDARAMARVLRESGFNVMLHTDLDHRRMMQAVRDFGDELRKGGVGLFYFAGHGVQIKGRNYLVPIGADIQREDEVAYAALDAQAVLDKMEAAGNGTNLLILDACRNNPFARSFRSSSAGLAQMDAPVGTLVAFATAPGMVASDGTGSNGLYTKNLLEAMRKPGLKVEDVFKQVRVAVRRDSGGKQVPWESTSLEGDLYFSQPPAASATATPARPQPVAAPGSNVTPDELLWSAMQGGADPAELRAFLRRYPESRFAVEARRRLEASAPAPPTAPTTAAASPPTARQAIELMMPEPPPRLALAQPLTAASSGPKPPAPETSTAQGMRPVPELVMPEPPPRMASGPSAMALTAGAMPNRSGAAPGAPATQTGINPRGYRVGDTWNFQVIDLWRREVTRNHTLRIARMGPDGELFTPAGSRVDPWGRLQLVEDVAAGRVREYTPFLPRGWEDWQPGRSTPVVFTESVATKGGTLLWRCEHDGTLKHERTENVKVPAGEFTARRIEIEARCRREAPGEVKTLHQWKHIIWYVPELRYYAAMEIEWRSANGQLDRREREELTSYEVQGTSRATR
jgi:uncharacterized caspase-like protein